MNKGLGHGRLHGCIAAAALKGICFLTKYELSGFKSIHHTLKNALKQWQTPKSVNRHM